MKEKSQITNEKKLPIVFARNIATQPDSYDDYQKRVFANGGKAVSGV